MICRGFSLVLKLVKRFPLAIIEDVEIDSTYVNSTEQVDILIDADLIECSPTLDVKKYVEEKAERLRACNNTRYVTRTFCNAYVL